MCLLVWLSRRLICSQLNGTKLCSSDSEHAAGANMLLAVPGDSLKMKPEDPPGPGGVLVCAENFVLYMNEGHETISCLIPRRNSLPEDRSILLTSAATHKIPGQFVILAQSEYGDIYKVRSLELDAPCFACMGRACGST